MKNYIEAFFGGFTIVVAALLIIASMMILDGFVFSKLWDWFIVTHFNANPIGIATAMGIGLIISLLTYQANAVPKEKDQSFAASPLFIAYARPIIFLIYGFILSYWV